MPNQICNGHERSISRLIVMIAMIPTSMVMIFMDITWRAQQTTGDSHIRKRRGNVQRGSERNIPITKLAWTAIQKTRPLPRIAGAPVLMTIVPLASAMRGTLKDSLRRDRNNLPQTSTMHLCQEALRIVSMAGNRISIIYIHIHILIPHHNLLRPIKDHI